MRRLVLLLSVIVLLISGCQARTTVDVEVKPNGSGSVAVLVTLDAAARAAVPNLAEQLQVADLQKAGWVVDGPKPDKAGNTVVGVRHGFDDAGQVNDLLKQISGPNGPFRDFRISMERSFVRTDVRFDGSIDLSKGIASFGDENLQQRVGLPLALDPDETAQAVGMDWAASFPVEVKVELPGGTERTPAAEDGVWRATYDSVSTFHAQSSSLNVVTLSLFGTAAFCILAAILVWALWKSDIYRPQHRKKRGSVRARDLLNGTASVE